LPGISRRTAISASGSLPTFASFTTLPCAFRAQSAVVAVGLIRAWNQPWLPVTPYNTALILPLAYCCILLPQPVRYATAAFHQIGDNPEAAARVLVLPGNHDRAAEFRAALAGWGPFADGHLGFARPVGDALVVGLDSNLPGGRGGVDAARLDWLSATLAGAGLSLSLTGRQPSGPVTTAPGDELHLLASGAVTGFQMDLN